MLKFLLLFSSTSCRVSFIVSTVHQHFITCRVLRSILSHSQAQGRVYDECHGFLKVSSHISDCEVLRVVFVVEKIQSLCMSWL